jgi:hypothetical protein
MASLYDAAQRNAILARLAALTPDSSARWGRMSVGQMLCHLSDSMRMGLGELPVKSKGKRAFQVFPLKQLILYVLPFPKGSPTAPELLSTPPAEFQADQERLRGLLLKCAGMAGAGMGPEHPLLGRLSRAEWGVLGAKHVDHHFTQFGV